MTDEDLQMKNPEPLFTPTADGQAYDLQPAGVMLLLANLLYGPQDDPCWQGAPNTRAFLEDLLNAASAGGYTQTDILHTLLVTCEVSERVETMVREACAAAGDLRIAKVFEDARQRKRRT
jgi:hypothetical protein